MVKNIKTIPLQPLGDRVVVLAKESEKKSAGGIILTEPKNEKPQMGTVVAVGPGKLYENGTREPMSVAIGDEVVFSTYSPDTVEVDGVEYLVLREESLLAIIK